VSPAPRLTANAGVTVQSSAADSSSPRLRLVVPPPRPHVLLVEDEPTIAVTLTDDLVAGGFVVTHMADGADAVRRLSQHAFAAVITDLRLPGASGHAVLRAAKAGCGIKVMVITAHALGQIEALSSQGADAVLPKPFFNQQVIVWLRAAIGGP